MSIESFIKRIETNLFRHRIIVLFFFIVTSVFLLFQATQIKLDASFTKNIPLNHEYMETYLKHEKNFGGANNVLISVCHADMNIFNQEFFTALKGVHDKLFYIPGVSRNHVKSLFSPSTRFIEIVEDGFSGGPVIPANFALTKQGLEQVKDNILKSGIVGSIVSGDHTCSMVKASLLEVDPETGKKLDTIKFAQSLENLIRKPFEKGNITVHIIGFSKMVGDVAEGAKGVILFFAIALVITTLMVYLFCRSIRLTLLPIFCSLIAVVWQMGSLSLLGFGLDPMSILLPFLIFAIGVSHGVQMINSIVKQVAGGVNALTAAKYSFSLLLIPGGIALLSDTVGFLTLLSVDIGIIRELAITASLGVAMIILTNLILLPVLVSYLSLTNKISEDDRFQLKRDSLSSEVWGVFAKFAKKTPAVIILSLTVILYLFGYFYAKDLKIGELHAGAPALHEMSRYNKDTFYISGKYSISVDYLSIIVEGDKSACTYHHNLDLMDRFQWAMQNTKGVESAVSLASISKTINANYNEGNPKWQVLARNTQTLVQSIAKIPTSSGLLNSDCSAMPIIVFLEDHKAETITRVIDKVKSTAEALNTDKLKFKLASGPIGVMAATNEAVAEAQLPMMWYVYSAVTFLCLFSFRSVKATVAVVLPLYVVSTLAQALMTYLNIGLTVSTLPVIALGVGIGVDYGIYILSIMNEQLKKGVGVEEAYFTALTERGSAVLFTAITLAVGVSTWVLSDLKFQVDMGILLTFMFVVNMLAALIVIPALSAFLWPEKSE